MTENSKRVFRYLLELLIVICGVFLGIYASEIQNGKKIKKEKEKSIHFIMEELSNNEDKLNKSIEYHQLIKVEIDSISKALTEKDMFEYYLGNKVFRHNDIKGWNGIKMANLESTAFETAKISGIIREYDIEFVKDISTIYSYQEEYLEFGNSILTKMINLNSSSKVADAFGSIELMSSDLLNFERFILEKVKDVQISND